MGSQVTSYSDRVSVIFNRSFVCMVARCDRRPSSGFTRCRDMTLERVSGTAEVIARMQLLTRAIGETAGSWTHPSAEGRRLLFGSDRAVRGKHARKLNDVLVDRNASFTALSALSHSIRPTVRRGTHALQILLCIESDTEQRQTCGMGTARPHTSKHARRTNASSRSTLYPCALRRSIAAASAAVGMSNRSPSNTVSSIEPSATTSLGSNAICS